MTAALFKPATKATGRDADPRRTLKLNGYAWQKLRASVLAGEPCCRQCIREGRTTVATDVDHHDGNPGNNEYDPATGAGNLTPLCHSCHSRKTASDHGKAVRWGCDEHGMPLDPCHHWHDAIRADTAAARGTADGEAQEITSNHGQ